MRKLLLPLLIATTLSSTAVVAADFSKNIKKSFDPKGIFNPGKMYTGN